MNNMGKNLGLWAIVILFLIILFNMFQGPKEHANKDVIQYSEFMNYANTNKIQEVELKGNKVYGKLTDGKEFISTIPKETALAENLASKGIKVKAAHEEEGSVSFLGVLMSWFPMILLIGVWIFFLRQMQSGSNKAMSFGKSKAKMLNENKEKITFDNVAGVDEAKQDVEEVVEFLRDPTKFEKLGGKIPKGILLVGAPGTGKTLLARAIAGEANVPFFSISGSDFVEMFVGVGASRVRAMFEQAAKSAPCIIFIDEIDAVGRHRGAGMGGGNDEREQTLNQLLVEMDGFEANEGVILIAATNRPDVLDPALLRPGRFDRQVVVPMPDLIGREQILIVHSKKVPLSSDVDLKVIARGTPGFSGADLANLINEAALLAARRNMRIVTKHVMEEAKDKVMMGAERKSLAMTEDEKKLTAYHEAGHAVVAYYSINSDPIHKATIIPRGRALGMVVRLPEHDRVSLSRKKIEADLAVAMGGRIAEEEIFGYDSVTTGASSDIKHATDIVRRMVTEWGMSDALGPLTYGEPSGEVFLGYSVTQHKNMSEATSEQVDKEVRRLADEAYARAKKILTKHKKDLIKVAEALLEFETLSGDEIRDIINGKKIERPEIAPRTTKRKKPTSSVPDSGKENGKSRLKPVTEQPY